MAKNGKMKSYAEMHKLIQRMNEKQLIEAIDHELDADSPRRDMLQRMIGRFNRLHGARFGAGVMAQMGRRTKSVRALLGSDR